LETIQNAERNTEEPRDTEIQGDEHLFVKAYTATLRF